MIRVTGLRPLAVCALLLSLICTDAYVPVLSSNRVPSLVSWGKRQPPMCILRMALDDDENLDPEELQRRLNKLTEEPPMFAAFDASNMDESALPIPTFTALVVAVGSLVWTYYLYDVGINGFRD